MENTEIVKSDLAEADAVVEDSGISDDECKKWLEEITAAKKREKDFRKAGARVVALFEAEKGEGKNSFNILYSNTETLAPALYSIIPRPIVGRRFKDEDPLGKVAAKAVQRALEFLVDSGDANLPTFDEIMKSAVLEALLPGRGLTRFKYTADVDEASGTVKNEMAYGEEVPWDRFLHGYAKKWKDVPWVCYLHKMSREELVENFGEAGKTVEMEELAETSSDSDEEQDSESKGVKLAWVYELWDKVKKEVLFITGKEMNGGLKRVADPLGLSGFYPSPRPLTFMSKVSGLVPLNLYSMYEAQAKELNFISQRITAIIQMMKVRGMYDASVEGLEKVLKAEDGDLIPIDNVVAMQSGNGVLEKAIWLMPIHDLVAVLQQLYTQRTQIKQVIYEITGISDILRGSSVASETATAQNIKNQWGTLRLKKLQKEVARYARDCLRILGEISVEKFAPETLKAMTGLPYPLGAEKQAAQQQVAMLQQQSQQQEQQFNMQVQQAQAMGQPAPQAPPPEQMDPKLTEVVGMPSWDELLGLLKSDLTRQFRIDVETNSTIEPEASEDQKNISDLLNALSQFLNGIAPLVESGSMPFEIAQTMMLVIARRFTFGGELEDLLQKMKAPPPPQPEPPDPAVMEQGKIAVETAKIGMQVAQMKAQADQQAMTLKGQQEATKAQMETTKMNLEMQKAQMEGEIAKEEHAMKMEEMRMKASLARETHVMKMQVAMTPKPAPAKPGGR